jgi:hypothetical protein
VSGLGYLTESDLARVRSIVAEARPVPAELGAILLAERDAWARRALELLNERVA